MINSNNNIIHKNINRYNNICTSSNRDGTHNMNLNQITNKCNKRIYTTCWLFKEK